MVTTRDVGLDQSTAALVVKVGSYPVDHGALAVVRTLGRAGVPVDAFVSDPRAPDARSRYLRRRYAWRGASAPDAELVEQLCDIGRGQPHRTILVPTDDRAAVLVADHAALLSTRFTFARASAELVRSVANKERLYDLCRRLGVPTPDTVFPSSADELRDYADRASFPVVVKSVEPWTTNRAVRRTTIVRSAQQLAQLLAGWEGVPRLLVQELVPADAGEDWMFETYCDERSECLVHFTGRKLRSWPPHAGVTCLGVARRNPHLTEQASGLCARIGYQGIADLCWRLDRRDGRYKLLDFNPRVGSQFRLFTNTAGVDVVRAMHLDLAGRAVPGADQVEGRRLLVENLDLAAQRAYRRTSTSNARRGHRDRRGRTECAWLAWDDPAPFVQMVLRVTHALLTRVARSGWQRERARLHRTGVGPPRSRKERRLRIGSESEGRCGTNGR
jgi:D-aspartate ligase